MIARLFIAICRVAVLRKFLNLFIYQTLAKHFRTEDWLFMNYGYDSEALRRNKITLSPCEEAHRYHIQLYQHLCSAIHLDGKDVLEIGSGRGGGAFYMKRYLGPRRVIGVDYSNNAVALCHERYDIDGLSFLQGDAEKLSLSDNTFDVVVNIESSHGYRSMETFLSEVRRLLRPGGYFLFADIRGRIYVDYAVLRQQFVNSSLILLKEEDITDNVLEAMDADKERKKDLIERHVPKQFRPMFYEFSGLPGSFIYDAFRTKHSTYHYCVLQKPVSPYWQAKP